MNKKLFRRKWYIKPRVFVMLLLLLVFSSVFIAFNLFTNQYIRSNVETQLDELTKELSMTRNKHTNNIKGELRLPNLSGQSRSGIGARGEVVILDANYKVKEYNEFSIGEDKEELDLIAAYLKQQNIELAHAKYIKVTTAEGEYYVTSMEDVTYKENCWVFYVSVVGMNHLVKIINLAMAAIVAAAMLICFVIANLIAESVTKPLKRLSKFADDIGKGNLLEMNLVLKISNLTNSVKR